MTARKGRAAASAGGSSLLLQRISALSRALRARAFNLPSEPRSYGDMNAPTPPPLPIRALIAPVTPLQQNCTIVWCAKTLKAAIIDPGGEVPRLMAALKEYGLTLEKIWICLLYTSPSPRDS